MMEIRLQEKYRTTAAAVDIPLYCKVYYYNKILVYENPMYSYEVL
jgi:hypothetical protein